MVARFVRDEEAVGSNPATPTKRLREQLAIALPPPLTCRLQPATMQSPTLTPRQRGPCDRRSGSRVELVNDTGTHEGEKS